MNKHLVKDLMVPISEYAAVQEGSSVFDAVRALEKAQQEYQKNRYAHRAVLILNKNSQIIGKLSQFDFLRASEPDDKHNDTLNNIVKFGFSSKLIVSQKKEYRKTAPPLEEIYLKAARLKVEDFMHLTSEEEFVDENTALDIAVHQLISGPFMSLLVTREKKIIGVLRMADVFSAVFRKINKIESSQTDKDE